MHRSFSTSTSDGGEPSAFPAHVTDTSAFDSRLKCNNDKVYSKRTLSKNPSSNLSLGSLLGVLPAAAFVNSDSPKECLSPLPSAASNTGSFQNQAIPSRSAQSVSHPVRNTKNYLAQFSREDLIRVIALYIDRHSHYDRPTPQQSNLLSVFFSVSPPQISNLSYVRRIINHTHCSPSAFIVALIYLKRISQRHDALVLSRVNLHRLFITAVTLAVKKLDDRTFPIAHYAKVGAVPSQEEMIRLEILFMQFVDYDLHVTYHPYAEMMNHMTTLLAVVRGNTTGVLGGCQTTSTAMSVTKPGNRMTSVIHSLPSKAPYREQNLTDSNEDDDNEYGISEQSAPQRSKSSSCSSVLSSGSKRRKVDGSD